MFLLTPAFHFTYVSLSFSKLLADSLDIFELTPNRSTK